MQADSDLYINEVSQRTISLIHIYRNILQHIESSARDTDSDRFNQYCNLEQSYGKKIRSSLRVLAQLTSGNEIDIHLKKCLADLETRMAQVKNSARETLTVWGKQLKAMEKQSRSMGILPVSAMNSGHSAPSRIDFIL